jgi:hypothetical protein
MEQMGQMDMTPGLGNYFILGLLALAALVAGVEKWRKSKK